MKATINKAYLAVAVGAVLHLRHQTAKSHPSALNRNLAGAVGSSTSQVRIRASSSSSAAGVVDGPARDAGTLRRDDQKLKAAEESLRMVVFLSCWGPN